MQRIAVICALLLAVGIAVGLASHHPYDGSGVVRAQTGSGGAAAGGGASGGAGAGAGAGAAPAAPMGAGAGAGGAAGAAAAGLAMTAQRGKHQVEEGQDVVSDVINGSLLTLEQGGPVHLAGVVLPREYVTRRSDYVAVEGTHPEGDWRRYNGMLYDEAKMPSLYTYRVGDDELRAFVFYTIVNRVVEVQEVGKYDVPVPGGDEIDIPDVVLTYSLPAVLKSDDTGPFNLNDQVIAKTKALGLWQCQWDHGNPKAFDCTTQTWAK